MRPTTPHPTTPDAQLARGCVVSTLFGLGLLAFWFLLIGGTFLLWRAVFG